MQIKYLKYAVTLLTRYTQCIEQQCNKHKKHGKDHHGIKVGIVLRGSLSTLFQILHNKVSYEKFQNSKLSYLFSTLCLHDLQFFDIMKYLIL